MTSALFPQSYIFRAFTQSGTLAPLAGGLLYFYQAGTTTPQDAYTDPSGATPVANPLALDANGVATFCLLSGKNYKISLTDSLGVVQDGYPVDNITADPTSLLGASRYAVDSGVVNAYTVMLNAPVTANYNGLRITFKAANTNTGASTFNSGAGAVALVTDSGAVLTAGTIVAGSIYDVIYDSATSKFWLTTAISGVTYNVDTGTANAYVVSIQAGTNFNGLFVQFKAAHTNTGASTLNVGGGATPILTNCGLPLPAGAIVAGNIYDVIYDSATSSYWMTSEPLALTYAIDTGAANAYVVSTLAANSQGARVAFKATNSNSGACTLNAGGGVVPLVSNAGLALVTGNIVAGTIYEAIYDSATASWWLINGTGLPNVGNTTIFAAAGTNTWFCLPGVLAVTLTLQGPGGNGYSGGAGFGGSAGNYIQRLINVKPHNTYQVVTGAPGSPSTFAWLSFDGTPGFTSDSGFPTISVTAGANGAAGGNTGSAPVAVSYTDYPEAGWTGTGGVGGDSYTVLTHVHGGIGASSPFGAGGIGGVDNGTVSGTAGTNPGSGGGGAATAAGTGGAGAPGYARIQF